MKWINKGHEFDEYKKIFQNEQKIIIFGAGDNGKDLYSKLGFADCVRLFIDNDPAKIQNGYCGKKVVSFQNFAENDEKPKLSKSELQKKQKDMSKRFYDICDVSIGHGDLKEAVNNAFNLYLDLFTEKTGKIHPILRNETLIDVCSALSHINDKEFNHFEEFDFSKPKEDGTMPLEEMVRLHFARSHNGKTDYSIAHFCNKKYLLKLAQFVMS